MKTSYSKYATGKGWYVNRSQGILERFDIKLLGTKEELAEAGADELHNLCYAMNHYQGIHSTAYAKAVYNKLNNAVKASKGNYAIAQQRVIRALDDMKSDLEQGKKFW